MPHRCPHTNVWIYEALPNGMRNATLSDLYTNGAPSGISFLLQSFFDSHLEAYSYTVHSPEIIDVFLPANKIFIKA